MATYDMIAPVQSSGTLPVVRHITLSDLKQALTKGLDDFLAMPTHAVFLCVMYPIAGILLGRVAFGYDLVPLLFPLAAGFALVGPFAAIGLYELSRRREMGLDTSWKHAFDVFRSPSLPNILALGLLLLLLFVVWIAMADAIYVTHFGYREPKSLVTFIQQVLTTPEGHGMMFVGNLVGFVFAAIAMSVSVVAFPLLLDRRVSVATAMLTSVRAVLRNPVMMAIWGLIVAAGLVAGFAALFVGLAVVLPVLGHATWHLYRAVVEPDDGPRPAIEIKPRGQRYGADFPASLFTSTRRREPE